MRHLTLIITSLLLLLGQPVLGQQTTLASLEEAGRTAVAGRDASGRIVVLVPARPELGHALEALVNRGLAVPTAKGVQLRPELTQTELDAALARKGWAVSAEVRRNREAITGLTVFRDRQVGLNWLFGASLVGLALALGALWRRVPATVAATPAVTSTNPGVVEYQAPPPHPGAASLLAAVAARKGSVPAGPEHCQRLPADTGR